MLDQDANTEKRQAARASLITALVLTTMKLVVGFYTNSLGILSEALHSGFDLLAALLTLYAVNVAARPADAQHQYGHGKVENLAALGETALLLITCGWIIGEAVERLFFKATPVLPSLWGVLVMGISIVLDVHRVRLLRAVAKKHNSQALEADALHFSSDILSSSVVLVGLVIIWGAQFLPADSPWIAVCSYADAVAALGVSLIVLHACYELSRKSINDLMDGGSGEMRQRVEEAAMSVPEVYHVHSVRMRSSGPTSFIDLTVCVPSRLSVESGHRVAHAAETAIQNAIAGADVTVHVEPIVIDDSANPVEILQNAAARHDFSVHGAQIMQSGAGLQVEVHAEMPGTLALGEAHQRVTAFEDDVTALLPGAVVVSHLEPLGTSERETPLVLPCTDRELELLKNIVEDVLLWSREAFGCHRLTAYRLGSDREEPYIHISFHCRMRADATVDAAHSQSLRMEQELRRRVPTLGRIVIHTEPSV